jgi:hypothetical protein
MAMPIYIRTSTKHLEILGVGPIGIPKLMCSIKMFLSRNVNHVLRGISLKIRKKIGVSPSLFEGK